MKNTKNLKTILLAVIVGVVGVTIAYAALSSTLNVSVSQVTQNSLTWNVGFTGSSATATVGGTSATGRSCGTATITPTTVTIGNTTLSKPDDSCTYQLTISNSGGINAKLTSINPTNPASTNCTTSSGPTMICGNITYKLASDAEGTALATNTTLNAGNTQTVYLIIKYTGTTVNSSAVTQSGASFSVVFSQL